jgi:hypothetical protein
MFNRQLGRIGNGNGKYLTDGKYNERSYGHMQRKQYGDKWYGKCERYLDVDPE